MRSAMSCLSISAFRKTKPGPVAAHLPAQAGVQDELQTAPEKS